MHKEKIQNTFIDKIFWLSFLFYFDPGGYQLSYFNGYLIGIINFSDFFFFAMLFCYLSIRSKADIYAYDKLANLKPLLVFLIVWLIYYIVVFGYLTHSSNAGSASVFLIKSRHIFLAFFLIYPIYVFTIRSLDLFIEYLAYIAIIILTLFFITLFTQILLVPLDIIERGFLNRERYFFLGYGDFFILPNIAMVIYIFKIKPNKYKLLTLIGFMMALHWIFTITRRHILGMMIVFLVYLLIHQYEYSKPIISLKLLKPIGMIIIFIVSVSFIYQPIGEIITKSAVNTYNTFILQKEISQGKEDLRLSFSQPFFLSLILESPYFGTGFDMNWFVGEEKSQGGLYEASDYPFLASLAAFGFVGISVFLFFYIWLIRFLYKSTTQLKKIRFLARSNIALEQVIFLMLLGYFIYLLAQYMNLFSPMGLRRNFDQVFFYIAIMAGTVKRIKLKIIDN